MAKSDRHKKLRRQEKAKTQLTGTKKLLTKAQNLYEPKLRAKKIVIREQLKSQDPQPGDDIEITTRKKQNIKDILSALNHHNTNIKKDALNGLLELISSKNDILISHLDRILEKVAGLTSEFEDSLRKENLRVAEAIFAQITEEQVQPFWNLLLTHIKCSLTNLNPTVRYSCLNFLFLLVSYFPNLVSKSSHIILPEIMNLVAATKPTSDTSKTKEDKSHLKIEVDTKERIRVLSLITACLDLNARKIKTAVVFPYVESKVSMSCSTTSKNDTHVGIYYPYGYQDYCSDGNNGVPGPSQKNFSDITTCGILNSNVLSQGLGNDSSETPDFWPQFVQSYLPLLCETWLEARPSSKGNGSGSASASLNFGDSRGLSSLPKSTVEILECIVTVMTKLIVRFHSSNSLESESEGHLNLIRRLRKSQGQNLKRYFFDCLPFSAVQDAQKKTLTSINLSLFHISAQLRLVDEKLMSKFETYINSLIKKSNLEAKQISIVLEIITLIRLPSIGNLSSKIINYSLAAGCFEIVHTFLLGILSIRNEGSEANILSSLEWDKIIPRLMEATNSLSSELLTILTFVGLRNLTDLKLELRKTGTLDKLRNYLQTVPTDDTWDRVLRLFYISGCLEFDFPKLFDLEVPIHALEIVKLHSSTYDS